MGSKRSDSIFIVYTFPSDEEEANGVENERLPNSAAGANIKGNRSARIITDRAYLPGDIINIRVLRELR